MRLLSLFTFLLFSLMAAAQQPKVSHEGQNCLDCHASSTPGIVEQLRDSAHARRKGKLGVI
ncbi:MAG TPA: hypothetical protein VEV41_23765 [Terriglobales bacterium]|nr:hypothetical protein [Terriglobales bacterium]